MKIKRHGRQSKRRDPIDRGTIQVRGQPHADRLQPRSRGRHAFRVLPWRPAESPFREPRKPTQPTLQGQQNPGQSDDGPVVNVLRAEKSPVLFNESLFDQPAEEDPVETYVSRRSTTSSARVRSIKHHPLIQGERQAEKKMFLQEINRMRDAGATTTRMYTDEDSLADIEFEHNRIKCNEEQISAVNFMKDMIKLGATGIELANSKFKLLRLNRWSADVTSDMERYNRPLSKIYQRYWRKGSVSPFVELAFLLFGGLIFHHFKNVLFGVGGNQPSAAAATRHRTLGWHRPGTSRSRCPASRLLRRTVQSVERCAVQSEHRRLCRRRNKVPHRAVDAHAEPHQHAASQASPGDFAPAACAVGSVDSPDPRGRHRRATKRAPSTRAQNRPWKSSRRTTVETKNNHPPPTM